MLEGQFVFTQVMSFLPRREFNACVDKYRGDRRSRGFSCRDQFLCLGFAQLTYREVELFFKWIKQHLRIKAFYGTSDNAVKTQVWIAISVYALVAIVKKELRIELSLYDILQILSLTLFEKTPLIEALNRENRPNPDTTDPNQLTLFDL